MLYFANPCGREVIAAMGTQTIGLIDTPAQTGRKQVEDAHDLGATWIADNGCFSDKWDQAAWWRFLEDNAHRADRCLFAVAPDVVGDAKATLDRSWPWLAEIRELGYKVAFVGQNGAHSALVPWLEIDCLFLGGTVECLPCGYVWDQPRKPERREPCPICGRLLTEWKLSAAARDLATEAKDHGLWLHMGRVSSFKRIEYADAIGCDSTDGTFLTFAPDRRFPELLSWLHRLDTQAPLFERSAT